MQQRTKQFHHPTSELPHTLLLESVARAVHELYGVSWLPRVVRQSRRIKAGSLDFVDYAVPCFELAKLVHKNPQDVVIEIVTTLRAQTDGHVDHYLLEAIDGYINIQLNHDYFLTSASQAATLYRRSKTTDRLHDIELLMCNQSLFDERQAVTTQLAFKYIYQLSRLLNIKIRSTQYIADNSEEVAQQMMTIIGSTATLRTRQRLFRDVKTFMTLDKEAQQAHNLSKLIRKVLRHPAATRNRIMRSIHPVGHDIIHEYELVKRVNGFIDNLPFTTTTFELVKDKGSAAVFLKAGADSIALRSADGMLLHAAYDFYALGRAVIEGVKIPAATLLILAPQRGHGLMKLIIDNFLLHYGIEKRVVFFDPMTSHADIDEIVSHGTSVLPTIKRLKVTLQKTNDSLANDETRHALLELIDSPHALRNRLNDVQLPAFFDALNGSVRALDLFVD